MSSPLERMLGRPVVCDTGGPIVYIGTLLEVTPHEFVLGDADMHDCRDGHVNKEHYVMDAHREGLTVNRRNVVVMRSAIISVSLLSDVVAD